jgi:hypothetical protein
MRNNPIKSFFVALFIETQKYISSDKFKEYVKRSILWDAMSISMLSYLLFSTVILPRAAGQICGERVGALVASYSFPAQPFLTPFQWLVLFNVACRSFINGFDLFSAGVDSTGKVVYDYAPEFLKSFGDEQVFGLMAIAFTVVATVIIYSAYQRFDKVVWSDIRVSINNFFMAHGYSKKVLLDGNNFEEVEEA